ncbi:Phytosulfokine [Artemisia annua]|uniref:Phytosulfokine n=1 Tax=Artemisia annua TaxID=35608 RepID=A0A2U1KZ56_ARTAN|nr:Phytosulfokine [Artemisia annua]
MSEINPHPPNPDPKNPDPINPNSMPPPVANDVVRSKRSTRNSSSDSKLAAKNTSGGSKLSLGVKKGTKKGSSKNRNIVNGMEGVEYDGDDSENMEVKDDGPEVSEGESEATMMSSSQGLTGIDGGSNLEAKNHGKSHVVPNISSNVNGSNEVEANTNVGMSSVTNGDMPVPFEENPVLNPSKTNASVSGNSNGDINVNRGGESNQWPKLSETFKNVGSKSDGGSENKSHDTVMNEKVMNTVVFFVSAFKGLTGYGNNKLTKFPIRINEQGREVKAFGRASFARVLIEVDASTELVDNIEVCYKRLGRSMNLKVEYAWKPPLCTHCKVFGHELRTCKFKEAIVVDEIGKTKNIGVNEVKVDGNSKRDEEWQEARKFNRNVASTSRAYGQQRNDYGMNRGGFNGRGRGGMQGRGGMFQRSGNENYNVKYVPVESSGKKVDDGIVMKDKNMDNAQNKGKGVARLWERLKPMAELDNIGNEWAGVISFIVNKPTTNNIWSVIQRLVLGSAVYRIWQERNNRRAGQVIRSEDCVFNHIVGIIRMKLLGLKLKLSPNVYKAAYIWNIPLGRNEQNRRMVEGFSMVFSWVNWHQEGIGLWKCNLIFDIDICGSLAARWLQ